MATAPPTDLALELGALRPAPSYSLTRRIVVRAMGFIYLVAFVSLSLQVLPLFGEDGLLPVEPYLQFVAQAMGGRGSGFRELPSIFWIADTDAILMGASIFGTLLSLIVLAGFGNVPTLLCLWALYLSFVHVGQIFYGYGWEYLLLEAGILAVFLVPGWKQREVDRLPTLTIFVLFRWLTFRLMFGAGLIKIRGDSCWTDLTCLVTHYETQPNPHPLSWLLHQAPVWFHQLGVLFNHFVELIVPFFVFGPRRARITAGCFIITFQCTLILSGNLSFLNWLTIVVALTCFDDDVFLWLRGRMSQLLRLEIPGKVAPPTQHPSPSLHKVRLAMTVIWALVVLALSLDPLANLLGPRQRMNASYNRLHLVNSYGAFGTIHRVRREVVLEGSMDEMGPDMTWAEYEFPCKPGAPQRAPCLVTPYHHRLQWQFWFASFANPDREAWLPHLAYKILHGRDSIERLIEKDPFDGKAPRYVRARLFEYEFTSFGEDGWWTRKPVEQWMKPVSANDPELVRFVEARGWPTY